MSPRKPPRLATWLLNRFGLARQNPSLMGDLLEEFRSGRSAAWFWRQTVVVILTGLARHVSLRRRLLTAYAIGGSAETAIAFALWRFHVPWQLYASGSEAASALIFRMFLAVVLSALCYVLFDFLKAHYRALPANQNMVMIASERFIGLLGLYWSFAMFLNSQWAFVFIQSWLLLWEVGFALKDSRGVRS